MRWRTELSPEPAARGLALDEALLGSAREGGDPMVRLWVGERAIVIGRSQRIDDEVDRDAAAAEGLPVLRRISGGGAVVHYPNNLNVSLTTPDARVLGTVEEAFSRVGRCLAAALETWGLDVRTDGSALVTSEGKISGAAQARRGNAVLYHFTLLVAPDAAPMTRWLRATRPGYAPTGVPSHPQRTTTLSELLNRPVSIGEAAACVEEALAVLVGGPDQDGALTAAESERAECLLRSRYEDPTWNAAR